MGRVCRAREGLKKDLRRGGKDGIYKMMGSQYSATLLSNNFELYLT